MTHSTQKPHIAFLGGGNMATAIITGMIRQGGFKPTQISVVEHNETQRALLTRDLGVHCFENIAFAQAQATSPINAWVLAVKPQNMRDALTELQPHLNPELMIISIAAGLSVFALSSWLNGHAKIIRTMPNTPALVGQGMTGIYANQATEHERQLVEHIFSSIGQWVWLNEEAQIDTITAISGSGPAYVFYIMEQLTQAAMDLGYDAATAKQLVQATFTGAVSLAGQSTDSIATLRERVTSKGGTTAAALAAFEAHGLDQAIKAGVLACQARAQTLAQELTQ